MNTANLSPNYLSAGSCYEKTTREFLRCALQPLECNGDNEIYHSSHWLQEFDKDVSARCSSQTVIQGLPSLGRCDSKSERYMCTSHRTACRLTFNFKDLDPTCTVVDDGQKLQDETKTEEEETRSYYGYCYDATDATETNRFCAWQFNECPDGYTWQNADPFFAHSKPDCPAEKVMTGACVDITNRSNFFCAVTAEVCEASNIGALNSFQYLKAHELALENPGQACYLTNGIVPNRQMPPIEESLEVVESAESNGVLAGIIIGVCAFLFLLVGAIVVMVNRKKRKLQQEKSISTNMSDDDESKNKEESTKNAEII